MLEVVKCQRRNQRMLEKGREPRMQRSQLNLKNVLPCLLTSFEEWAQGRNTKFEYRVHHHTLAQLANHEKCLKFNGIRRIVLCLAALIDAVFDNLLRSHYHPVIACVFDRCRLCLKRDGPPYVISWWSGWLKLSHAYTLVQCFSLSTLKNQGYSSTHWHHGISHDPQVLPVWAVLRMLCAEYDDESIGIRKKCKRGTFFAFAMMMVMNGWTNIQ